MIAQPRYYERALFGSDSVRRRGRFGAPQTNSKDYPRNDTDENRESGEHVRIFDDEKEHCKNEGPGRYRCRCSTNKAPPGCLDDLLALFVGYHLSRPLGELRLFQQLGDVSHGPEAVRNARRHRGRAPQRLVDAQVVVVHVHAAERWCIQLAAGTRGGEETVSELLNESESRKRRTGDAPGAIRTPMPCESARWDSQ